MAAGCDRLHVHASNQPMSFVILSILQNFRYAVVTSVAKYLDRAQLDWFSACMLPVPSLFTFVHPQNAYLCSADRCLCTGEKGLGKSGKLLHFKGSTFHRVIPGFMCQVCHYNVYFWMDNNIQVYPVLISFSWICLRNLGE